MHAEKVGRAARRTRRKEKATSVKKVRVYPFSCDGSFLLSLSTLLFQKGSHATAAQRYASALWRRGDFASRCSALAMQVITALSLCGRYIILVCVFQLLPLISRVSFVRGLRRFVCIRAALGRCSARTCTRRPPSGFFLDHASGVVIRETAVVGARCTMLHSVTLHPATGGGPLGGRRRPVWRGLHCAGREPGTRRGRGRRRKLRGGQRRPHCRARRKLRVASSGGLPVHVSFVNTCF
jgi:hypothetical protein